MFRNIPSYLKTATFPPIKICLFITIQVVFLFAAVDSLAQIRNFDSKGHQLTRFSTAGDAIDAHDGEIAQFGGIYYLYGTSYDCGFEWGNKNAPFCGFKVYSSVDLKNWRDRGYLFDAGTTVWQTRCDGRTYGCFRPHVIYNKKNRNYVLWINVYDNVSGYRVFISKSPLGPFKEVAEPKLAVNAGQPAGGLNNGDHDTFVDDDGKGYIAYTDWRAKGSIVIEQLNDDYLSGSGKYVRKVTDTSTEAPAIFKRNGLYYLVYSDPNCGYCSGTGTSYRTARHPLGPWSKGKPISNNSCGGQPSFVSTIKVNSKSIYLYGSDLWNNAAKNEALANYYWAPLQFENDGAIRPLNCASSYLKVNAAKSAFQKHADEASSSHLSADVIDSATFWAQAFVANDTRVVKMIHLWLYKVHAPDSDLNVAVYKIEKGPFKLGKLLFSKSVPAASLGWSSHKIEIALDAKFSKKGRYAIVLSTNAKGGYFGFEGTENFAKPQTALYYRKKDGSSFRPVADTGAGIKYSLQ